MLRSPGFRRPNPARRPPRSNVKKPRAPRRAGPKEAEAEEGDDARLHEVNNAYRDITEAAKPVPVRYDPHQPDFSTLKETWPSLPTDASARAALVSEKLAGLSERYPNGYDPAHELGKRLFDGKPVQFANEEERNQAVEEAKKLAQKQADKLTQEKGDLVEPEEIIFDPISEADRKSLFRSLVQGDYTERESKLAETSPPVFADIMAGLKNNPTYQTAGKSSQFVAKVDSLLSSRRPAAKRG